MKYSILTAACVAAQVFGDTPGSPDFRIFQDWMQRSNGVYSLHEAAAVGDTEILAARLQEGAQINLRDETGATPLHLAAAAGDVEAVRLLLQAGADCLAKDSKGRRPADLTEDAGTKAALAEYEPARAEELRVAGLIQAGDAAAAEAIGTLANPNALAEDGATSLLALAVIHKHEDLARKLVEKGADLGLPMTTGEYILHYSVGYATPEFTTYLLAKGADPMKEVAADACTALHYAVWDGKEDHVRAILPAYKNCNFNPGLSDRYPVHMAISLGRTEILQAFIQAGMDVNSDMFRHLPLLVAATRQHNEAAVKLLLEAGADKSARDNAGKCAADYATGACAELLK